MTGEKSRLRLEILELMNLFLGIVATSTDGVSPSVQQDGGAEGGEQTKEPLQEHPALCVLTDTFS